jgi:hypothetical protein
MSDVSIVIGDGRSSAVRGESDECVTRRVLFRRASLEYID